MILSSLRDRFAPKTEILETSECRMHVHADPRERVIDQAICHEVQEDDCYRVRELAASGFAPRVIVDIGAHIGSFTALAAKYFPEARIYSFEPLKQHYAVLVKNARAGRCTPKNAAVLGFWLDEEGHDVHPSSEFERAYRARQLSNAISVADLLRKYDLKHIDWLKIDCEQSEVNIFRELDHLGRLKDIDVISGEWHFETAKNELRTIVGKTHDVEIVEEGLWNHFHARRKGKGTAAPAPTPRLALCKVYGVADAHHDDPLWRGLLQSMCPNWQSLGALHRKYWEWGLGLYGLHRLGFVTPDAVGLGVGAGVEWPLFYLANRIRRVEAIDLYPPGSDPSRDPTVPENLPRIAPFPFRQEALVFRRMDALDLEYPDGAFDFVFSFSSIEHFGGRPGAVLAMQEIARVLKPNGVAAIATELLLDGPAHPEFFAPSEIEPTFVAGSGLELVDPLDLRVDEELVRNPVVFDTTPGFSGFTGPHTYVKMGDFVITSIELFLRKPPAWTPMSDAERAAAVAGREAWMRANVR